MKRLICKMILVVSFFGQTVYSSECPNEEYITYRNLSFVHEGFVSLYGVTPPKTQKGSCDLRAETYLYNKSTNKNKPILVGDEVVGIKEYGRDMIAISATTGAHGGQLRFFKKRILNKNEYPEKFILKPIEIENEGDTFYSNMGMSIFVHEYYEMRGDHPMLKVDIYSMDNGREIRIKKYKLSYKDMKFISKRSMGRNHSKKAWR